MMKSGVTQISRGFWKLKLLLPSPKVSVRVVLPELRAKLLYGKKGSEAKQQEAVVVRCTFPFPDTQRCDPL